VLRAVQISNGLHSTQH